MQTKWYEKRAFWLLFIDALAAVGGILVPLAVGAEVWKIVLGVWTAMQPAVIFVVKELTVEEAAQVAAQRTVRDLAARGLLVLPQAARE